MAGACSASQVCAVPTDSDAENTMNALLRQLPDGSRVAVVSMLGSLCPITLGHVQCYEEARRLLLDQASSASRPDDLEDFAECIGFVYLNDDEFVGSKIRKKGQRALNYEQRSDLVRLATAELPWLCFGGRGTLQRRLSDLHPNLEFVEYDMNGADDVVKYRKWSRAGGSNRMIVMGRPGFTDDVRSGIQGVVDQGRCALKHCLLGPELPDISSTAARSASVAGDRETLLEMLHPSVADWLLHSDSHAIQEKTLVTKFFNEIAQDTGKYCFGMKETMQGLEMGAVESLICWESLEMLRVVIRNPHTHVEQTHYITPEQAKDPKLYRDEDSNVELELTGSEPFVEWIAVNYKNFGAKLDFITDKSQEGNQFVKCCGGIGGILRYRVEFEVDSDDDEPDLEVDSDDDFM